MPEQEKKEAETVMPEIVEGNNVIDGDPGEAQTEGGAATSIAPSIESVSNVEGMVAAKKKIEEAGDKVEKIFKFPKLFIKKEDLVQIDIDVIFDPTNGDVYSITQKDLINTEDIDLLECASYYFKFKPISYDNIQAYRSQASTYDSMAKDLVINRLTLRNLFLMNHLKETNLVDEEGKPVEIEINEQTDAMSIAGMTMLFQTVPALLDVAMTLFEKKLLTMFQVGQ